MRIFHPIIEEVRQFLDQKRNDDTPCCDSIIPDNIAWPFAERPEIILKRDLALELGSPETASVSFLVWTSDLKRIHDRRLTVIGPDIADAKASGLPLGKIVMVGLEGFDENNAYERNREIYLKKFDLALKGVMLKSASHYMAEWIRINREAKDNGISFSHLAGGLMDNYLALPYVKTVEMIFVTSSKEDVNTLYDMGNRAARTIQAMHKMTNEMSFDCAECEFQDLCEEADELRDLRGKMA